jgi:transcriptional regulator with XRE-family HTH domain
MDIKALRTRLGFTQKAFAERLRVAVLTVKRWEAGQTTPPTQYHAALAELDRVSKPASQQTAPVAAPPRSTGRPTLRLGQAVRLMGLTDDDRAVGTRRSDRTIRNALLSGVLKGWKAPGYRAAIAEWEFYADDFETWRRTVYQAHRDPRRNDSGGA